MNKIIALFLIGSALVVADYGYNGSTTAPVTMAGGIIKAKHSDSTKKYKRKDCPVCKGKGWYISGDDITKVPCGYCEPDKVGQEPSEVTHPPVILKPDCKTRVIRK